MCNSSELWSLQEAFQWLLSVKVGKASKHTQLFGKSSIQVFIGRLSCLELNSQCKASLGKEGKVLLLLSAELFC